MIYYPAIFTQEGKGFWVRFPDLDGCLTQGKTMKHAIEMAQEAMDGYYSSIFERKIAIPQPSDFNNIKLENGEKLVIIHSNVDAQLENTRSVKKTLTIPAHLNIMAEKQGVNFSALLKEALEERLSV